MIITRIGGGLGNQMFQYATARALALRNKTNLKLDIYDIIDKTPGHYLVDRDFDLGLLMAPIDFASLADFGAHSLLGAFGSFTNFSVCRTDNPRAITTRAKSEALGAVINARAWPLDRLPFVTKR